MQSTSTVGECGAWIFFSTNLQQNVKMYPCSGNPFEILVHISILFVFIH